MNPAPTQSRVSKKKQPAVTKTPEEEAADRKKASAKRQEFRVLADEKKSEAERLAFLKKESDRKKDARAKKRAAEQVNISLTVEQVLAVLTLVHLLFCNRRIGIFLTCRCAL